MEMGSAFSQLKKKEQKLIISTYNDDNNSNNMFIVWFLWKKGTHGGHDFSYTTACCLIFPNALNNSKTGHVLSLYLCCGFLWENINC